MLSLEEARDIVNAVVTELKTKKVVIISIQGEDSFLNYVDSKSTIKKILKKRNLPVFVMISTFPSEESGFKPAHVLVFIRIRELKP